MWFEHLTTRILNRIVKKRPARVAPGLLLGKAVGDVHAPVVLADRFRCEHAVVLGKTGSGKTYLLESLAWQIGQRNEGFALIDFHGDLSLSLIGRLSTLPAARERLIILDPSHPTLSPGLNILEATDDEGERSRRVSELSGILRARWGVDSFGARTEELLRNSLYVLAANHLTIAELPKLLTNDGFRQHLVRGIQHPDIKSYFSERYDPLSDGMKAAFREPLLNRITAFLTEPAARHLLAQRRSTIDIPAIMAAGQWLVIRLPKGRLREHAHTLANLIFAQLQFAAMSRDALPRHQRHTFTLICDEVQNLAENDLETLLTEARKFGISLVTANQYFDQLPRELRGALLTANTHICFRLSNADASVLSAELSSDHRSRTSLGLTELNRGEAIGRTGADPAVRFKVPAMPNVEPVPFDRLTELVARVARPRTEIEADIRRIVTPAKPIVIGPGLDGEEGLDGW